MKEKLSTIKKELLSISSKERLFILFAMLCGFCITAEYAITKPTSGSIFIAHYGVKFFPYAWLMIVPLNLFVVSIYNRFLFKAGYFKMFCITVVVTIAINCFSAFFIPKIFLLSFFLYMWKDIYCLLMFQQLWSQINSVTQISRAKYLYGIIFGVSGCGAIVGSAIPGFFAIKIGSEHLLLMTLPIYSCFIIFYYFLLRKGRLLEKEKSNSSKEEVKESKKEELGEGFKLVFSSRALKFILLIVVLMQFSTTIVEYQFNTFLAKILPNQDVRTEYYGRLWGIVNTLKVCIQFFASFLLIQFLGLRRTHFVLPGILLANTCLCLLVPQFAIFAYSFTLIKTFDYSLFNVLKEMLYLPLSKREKFKAKAVIDIFAYRSAKALASLFVIGLEFFCPLHLPYAFSWGPFFFFLLWLFGVYQMFKPEKEGAIA